MSGHSREHEALLESLWVEHDDVAAALERSVLGGCARCREILAELERTGWSIDALAVDERQSLREARNHPVSAGAAEEHLRRFIQREQGKDESGPGASTGTLARWTAVAAVVLALAWMGWRAVQGEPDRVAVLGAAIELLEPGERAASAERFRWTAERPASGSFVVTIRSLDEDGILEVLSESPRLEEAEWRPSPRERARIEQAGRVHWTVEVLRGSGARDVALSAGRWVDFSSR